MMIRTILLYPFLLSVCFTCNEPIEEPADRGIIVMLEEDRTAGTVSYADGGVEVTAGMGANYGGMGANHGGMGANYGGMGANYGGIEAGMRMSDDSTYCNPVFERCFTCNDGTHIHYDFFCDGVINCPDQSDERSHAMCNIFICLDGSEVISYEWVCDGFVDCIDESDEQYCGM